MDRYDFSYLSIDDLVRMFTLVVRVRFPKDQEFIHALREEIKHKAQGQSKK